MHCTCYKHGTNNFHRQLTSYNYIPLSQAHSCWFNYHNYIVCGTGKLKGFLLKYIFASMVDANDGNLANYNGPN